MYNHASIFMIESSALNEIINGLSEITNNVGDKSSNFFEKNFFKNVSSVIIKNLLEENGLLHTSMCDRDLNVNFRKIDMMSISEWNVIFREHCSEKLLMEFEKEFEDMLASLNKDLPKKLKSNNIFRKLFCMWMISLCSLASIGNGDSNDQDGMFGLNLFN